MARARKEEEEVRMLFEGLSKAAGVNVAELFGVGVEGTRLGFADFRSPEEVRRRHETRRTDVEPADGFVPASQLAERRKRGRQRFTAMATQDTSRRSPRGTGGTTTDDVAKACNMLRAMGEEYVESVVCRLHEAGSEPEGLQARTQSMLLELLGEDNIDVIVTLLRCREACIEDLMDDLQDVYETVDADDAKKPAFGTNFTVTHKSDMVRMKQRQKQRRNNPGLDRQNDLLRRLANERKRKRVEKERNAAIFQRGGDMIYSLEDTTRALPGTTTTEHAGYTEVNVPMKERPKVPKTDLFPVSDLPDWAQLAFPPAITHLNPVQTKVVRTAFFSSENMLVAAPTGAGKTICALLCMLQEVGQHIAPDKTMLKEDFKMVYIAPMKALAQEMVENFKKKLQPYGLVVKELTGDAQLTKREMAESNLIITTPEKWDVVTRKNTEALVNTTNLVIFDEVHLLNEDRGPVIEVLVARLLRRSQVTQQRVRLVGLSATLPNARDVSDFLGCNRVTGYFVFGSDFRPVPLQQTFIGIQDKARSVATAVKKEGAKSPPQSRDQKWLYDQVCFDHCVAALRNDKQVMIFVHARKKTFTVAKAMHEMAVAAGLEHLFRPEKLDAQSRKKVGACKNPMVQELFPHGLGIHHAGLLKNQRRLTEDLFGRGDIRVLCCTATLAWGVNLPAHTVIINDTQVYNAQRGRWVDIGILDVMQIFGRAGRPQFDVSGHGIIITSRKSLPGYVASLTHTAPIESQLGKKLTDHINAEVVLGNVSSPEEAWNWFKYTYFYTRLLKNPLAYGLKPDEPIRDPQLRVRSGQILREAIEALDHAKMAVVDFGTSMDNLQSTVVGRIASHFYISHETILRWTGEGGAFRERRTVNDMGAALMLVSQASEFDQVQLRDEEVEELLRIRADYCILESRTMKEAARVKAGGDDEGSSNNNQTKTRTLIQAWIANYSCQIYSLMNDMQYIADNTGRICRALVELSLHREAPNSVNCFLGLAKMVEKRAWYCYPEILQFGECPGYISERLKDKHGSTWNLLSMSVQEIGHLIKNWQWAKPIKDMAEFFPRLEIRHEVSPITPTIIRVKVELVPWFRWSPKHHGMVEPWHLFVEDTAGERIYHKEFVLLNKKEVNNPRWDIPEKDLNKKELNFTLPIHDGIRDFTIRAVSDRWVNAEDSVSMQLNFIAPNELKPFTELLRVNPLDIKTVLAYPKYRQIMKFTHLNSVQTQCFHTLYHSDNNVLFGAPTGSGKTVAAELAMFRVFNLAAESGKDKIVYIAPLKALVKERMRDWTKRFHDVLGKTVLELSGDHTPDVAMLNRADILCCTPEKWDGISRNWQNRSYVQGVALVVIDEIHMLGGDRGPILEVIVSRMRYMGWHLGRKVRVIGLSTALANAVDLASWMGIEKVGLYNFRPQIRPVPLDMHIQGYPGRHYCPRMATMNKPTFTAIEKHSRYVPQEGPFKGVQSVKPVIVFVSSRRQTRLTALDLINFLAVSADTGMFTAEIHPEELEHYVSQCQDEHLRHCLQFGIGLHHAGLNEGDKDIMEHMFVTGKLRVLVATSTLAWGVNFPAHLVVIKGTEFFDAKTKTYVDYSLTDVLQMMGRAGRPQFDNQGVAVVMVHEPKKTFYKKFVHDPFPVESSLHKGLHEHINAEIVAGTIAKRQDAIDYLTWTYLFRRLYRNPSYYGLESPDHQAVSRFLSGIVEKVVRDLQAARCLEEPDDEEGGDPDALVPSVLGRIASFYYMSYTSALMFEDGITEEASAQDVLKLLTEAAEFAEIPVRHNEDKLNAELARSVPLQVDTRLLDSPHVKTHLLLQAHFSRAPLPISDYVTDTKSVLENAIRVVQAMVDISANNGFLFACLRCMSVLQMILQGRWLHDNTLLQLPHLQPEHLPELKQRGIGSISEFLGQDPRRVLQILKEMGFSMKEEADIRRAARMFPVMDVRLFYDIEPDEDGVPQIKVTVELIRVSDVSRHVYAPCFPKPKDEQWWIVLGDAATGELLALKRINRIRQFVSTSLVFEWDEDWDEEVKDVTAQDGTRSPGRSFSLYVMCDSYIGCDMQYAFDVIKPLEGACAAGEGEEEEEEEDA